MAVLTQDIPDIQVIVEYPNDQAGFYWHHRILLKKISNGIWLTLTPDLEISRHDLNVQNHIILDRNSPFPAAQSPFVYAFDPVSKGTIEAKKRQAAAQAVVLGDDAMVEIAQVVWVIAERGHSKFGDTIPAEIVDNAGLTTIMETKGVCTCDGVETFIQKMLLSEVAAFKSSSQPDESDIRLLGVHTDKGGKRKLELEDSLALMKEEPLSDFPLGGDTRAAKEFLVSVSEGPGSLARYHVDWQRLSGISDGSSINHTHKNLCELLRLMHSYDQINVVNTACGEFTARWLVQLEIATERNPRNPDFSGLDLIMGGAVNAEGKAITAKFTQELTTKLKERANIYKQERLYREEQRHLTGAGRGHKGDSPAKGKGKKGKGYKSSGGTGNTPPAASA